MINHVNIQPVYDVYANVQGSDLGSAARQVARILSEYQTELGPGNTLSMRGQVESMQSAFIRLGFGLIFAAALVYLLMVVNFQSWLDPFIIITALPGALVGIVWMLFATGTTFSVPSLMGAIMAMGVATANSILLVTFANGQQAGGRGFDRRRLGSGPDPHASGPDDRLGHGRRNGPHGVGIGRRRRAERTPGPGRDRWTDHGHLRDLDVRSRGLRRVAAQHSAAKRGRLEVPSPLKLPCRASRRGASGLKRGPVATEPLVSNRFAVLHRFCKTS